MHRVSSIIQIMKHKIDESNRQVHAHVVCMRIYMRIDIYKRIRMHMCICVCPWLYVYAHEYTCVYVCECAMCLFCAMPLSLYASVLVLVSVFALCLCMCLRDVCIKYVYTRARGCACVRGCG